MKRKITGILLAAVLCTLPLTAMADFSPGNLIVVNEPSAASQGVDSLIEFDT